MKPSSLSLSPSVRSKVSRLCTKVGITYRYSNFREVLGCSMLVVVIPAPIRAYNALLADFCRSSMVS